MPARASGRSVISVRLDDARLRQITQLQERQGLGSRTDAIDLLIERGMETIHAEDHGGTGRAEWAIKGLGLVEALSDLLARLEQRDPDGAVLLARGLAKSTVAYAEDLEKRYA